PVATRIDSAAWNNSRPTTASTSPPRRLSACASYGRAQPPGSRFTGRRFPMAVAVALIVIVLVILVMILLSGFRIVLEYERGVIFRLGRCVGAKGPGLFYIIPI